MNILVLNSGSSSVKFQLIEAPEERVLGRGVVDRIGHTDALFCFQTPGREPVRETRSVADHEGAVQLAIATVTQVLSVDAIGHRFVHGGERFAQPVAIDAATAREIEQLNGLAPLHNPHNLRGYHAARAALPGVPQVAVFDTAFHQTLPRHAYLYALPYELYERHGVRRYGFHGTSHRYVSERYARLRGVPPEKLKVISCHLGNGCSMCAVDGGRSVDTSMGFTPLEGLVMGTRSGDIDAAAVLHLMAREGLDGERTDDLLNKRSGLLGLSGLSNDIRTVLEHAAAGHERARLAIDSFCYRIRKYIGAYYAVLNGADAVLFTGGIGENRPEVRARVCSSLEALGIRIDPEKNLAAQGLEMDISGEDAATRVWVIPTHEEMLIARETMLCLTRGNAPPESR